MLAAQIPPDADIAAQLPADGDYVLYRACAAHLAQDASLLSAESTDEDAVIASLRGSMRALREAGAAEPPPLDGPLSEAIMTSLVEDVESRGGGLFRRLEDQPDVKDVLLDVFNEERLEHQRGWRGLAADGDGGAAAMDDATAAAAAAAKEAAAEGRSFRVAIIGGGASGLTAAIKLKQAGIDFVVLERNSSVGGVWWQNSYPDGKCSRSLCAFFRRDKKQRLHSRLRRALALLLVLLRPQRPVEQVLLKGPGDRGVLQRRRRALRGGALDTLQHQSCLVSVRRRHSHVATSRGAGGGRR